MTKMLTPAEQEELNRINSETVTLGNATGKELGALQGFDEAAKATLSPSAAAATALGMAASTPFVLWDKGTSFLTGKESTAASDWVFKNVVDDIGRRSEQYWRPNPDAMGSGARVGSMGFQLFGTVPQIMASPTVSIAGMTFSPTMDLVDQGASDATVLKAGATNLAVNAVGFGLPAAWGKTLFSRIATGSVSNALLGGVQEGYTGKLLTAEGNEYGSSYRWDNMENRLFELAIGGMFGYKVHADAMNDPGRHRVSSDEQAAVFAQINQDSLTNRTMPGLPMSGEATRQHMTAMDTAIQQILKGERVNVADSLDLNNFLVRPELRPSDYQPSSATGKTAASYGAAFLTDPNVYADFTAYRHALEVGKLGPDAKNPVSSATGNGQFIDETWLALVKSHKPAWAVGLNRSQLLELRKDPEITAEMLKYQDQDHTAALLNAGLPVNFFTMYAAHHFGIGKGKAFAKASGDTPMTDILTKAQIDANPHLRGMTKDGAQSYWNQKAESLGAKPESNIVNIERRADPEKRKRIADLTADEARQELATSELTGGKNRRAYEDAPKLPVQVFMDANNLKWVNDNMGHATGDKVIKAMHQALAKHTDEVYHLSGDEFVIQAKTEKQAKKIMADVQAELAKVVMEAESKDGRIISKTGVGIGFGMGKTLDAADRAMLADKAAQEAGGRRQARDANGLPFGVTIRAPEYANGIPKGLPSNEPEAVTAKLSASLSRVSKGDSAVHDGVRGIERGLLPARLAGLLDAFDQVTGRPVTVVRNLSPEVKRFNGATDGQRIFLSEDSQHPLVTVAGHEFGHVLQQNHPQLYTKLTAEIERQADVKRYGAERNYATDRTLIEPSKATVELTNDAIGDALTDPAFLKRMAKESPNVFQEIADKFIAYLNDLLERMGKIVGYGSDRYLSDVEAFRDQLASVLNQYVSNDGKPPDEAVQFSDTLDGQRPQPEDLPDYVPPPVELTAEERFAMPKADQAKADAEQAKLKAEYEKQRSLRHKVLSAVAGDQLRQAIAAFPGPPMQALDHILARSADVKGNVLSVESQAKAIREDAFRQIIPVLEATNPKFFGLFENKQGVRELVMELHGQDTGNPDAKAGAKAFRKVADQLRERFNRAGGDVGQIEDWGMPHHHSQHLVAKAGKAKWVADITPKLNRKRYDMSDAELNDMLGRVWETIATNGVNKLEPGQYPGSGKVANRGNEARQLHFMDGDAYLAYQHDYGEAAPYETLTGHIGRLAHDIAMIETMGPNPDQMFRTLKDEAFKAQVTADPTNMGKHEKQARWLDTLYREVSGKARPVASRAMAKAFDEWRSLMVASKLGGAAITAITDHGTMHTAATAANLPQLQLFANELAAFNPANAEEKARLNRMGLGLSSMIGELNRFGNDVVSSGFFNKLGTATMRVSGMAASTDARRRAYGATMLDAVGAITKKHATLADIDPMDHRVLMSKGITETDFQVWKQAELDELGANHTMLTPDAIYAIPDAKLADITDAMGNPMDPDQLRQQAVTKLLGATFDEVDIGVIEPSARERALMHGDRVRGTLKGELLATFFLFKSFPVTMITKHWQRMMSMPTNRGKAAYGVSLMASTTVLGMVAMQIANMLQGKDPQDMTDGKAWVKALLKGGGLSLFGDYLVADQTQYGGSFIASLGGPGAGMIEDTYNLTLGNLHQAQRGENTHIGAEAIKFAKSNTPFANLWYTRAATDHLIVNELQEMASPGYLRKMEKRAKKEYDETYFWKPGTPFPQRAPNLDKAVGE